MLQSGRKVPLSCEDESDIAMCFSWGDRLLECLEALVDLALLCSGQAKVDPGFFVLRLELDGLGEIVFR